MAGKHGPNKFADYQCIHETVMAKLRDEGFILKDDITFRPLGDNEIFLGGPEPAGDPEMPMPGYIECVGGIRLKVEKYIAVLDGSGANAVVQTRAYSYNASLAQRCNIVRYCSPHAEHDEHGHPSHHYEHHRHSFNVFVDGNETTEPEILDEERRPTLGQVLEELRDWYYENYDAVEAHRLVPRLPPAHDWTSPMRQPGSGA